MNDFNTIEESGDAKSSPAMYLRKLGEIQAFLGTGAGPLGIGLEGHFGSAPNLPYVRSAIDTLAAKNLPIWVTEVDVKDMPDQVKILKPFVCLFGFRPGKFLGKKKEEEKSIRKKKLNLSTSLVLVFLVW